MYSLLGSVLVEYTGSFPEDPVHDRVDRMLIELGYCCCSGRGVDTSE